MFYKKFDKFKTGLEKLCKISFSAAQALEGEAAQSAVKEPLSSRNGEWGEKVLAAMKLAANVASDSHGCNMRFTSAGLSYKTSGGLVFGWNKRGIKWNFFLQHPEGKAPEDSSLRESALRYGWQGDEDELPPPEVLGLLGEKLKAAMASAAKGENRTA